jgi:hypothetical protein
MVLKRKEPEAASTVFGTEEALARIAMELLEPSGDKLYTVTDVTPEEIFSIAVINRYATLFKSSMMENWVNDFLKLRISRFRLGRREFLLLAAGIKESEEAKKKGKVTDLFAGLK